MTTTSALGEIVAVYQKHGWVLRRVLLSPRLKDSISVSENDIGNAAVFASDIDALWFSRPPQQGGVPWEIRHLSSDPYALLFTIDEFDEGFEDSLESAEEQFRSHVAARKVA